MRLGVRLGPVSVSGSTRRRRPGGGFLGGMLAVLAVAAWPFALGQTPAGPRWWVWLIAVPWWIVLAVAVLALLTRGGGRKP